MSEIRVATRYAKSLFDLAVEKNVLDAIEKDAKEFLDLNIKSRPFHVMLKSPIVNVDKKWHVFEKVFKASVNPMTMEFIKIVLRKRRDLILPEIFTQFLEMYRESKNIKSVTAYTAVPVTDKIVTEIRKYLATRTNATIELKNEINKELLGGFVLKYDDKLVDASVATQLRTLKNNLINAN